MTTSLEEIPRISSGQLLEFATELDEAFKTLTENYTRKLSINSTLCACPDHELMDRYDSRGRERRFIKGHKSLEIRKQISLSHIGKKLPPEQIEKISQAKMSDKNPMWKADAVGYEALHEWIRNHLHEPDLCQTCNNKVPYDLANITGIYNRDLINWKYLCRSCHMQSDGRMDNLCRGRKSGFKHSEETKRRISEGLKRFQMGC